MTPLPKRRWSTQRQGKRRASQKAKSLTFNKCDNCGALKEIHTACPKCGFYRGRLAIKIKQKAKKTNHSEEEGKTIENKK